MLDTLLECEEIWRTEAIVVERGENHVAVDVRSAERWLQIKRHNVAGRCDRRRDERSQIDGTLSVARKRHSRAPSRCVKSFAAIVRPVRFARANDVMEERNRMVNVDGPAMEGSGGRRIAEELVHHNGVIRV